MAFPVRARDRLVMMVVVAVVLADEVRGDGVQVGIRVRVMGSRIHFSAVGTGLSPERQHK